MVIRSHGVPPLIESISRPKVYFRYKMGLDFRFVNLSRPLSFQHPVSPANRIEPAPPESVGTNIHIKAWFAGIPSCIISKGLQRFPRRAPMVAFSFKISEDRLGQGDVNCINHMARFDIHSLQRIEALCNAFASNLIPSWTS